MEALRISVVRTQQINGAEEITHVGGTLGKHTRWFTLSEVLDAIQRGERFYIQSGAESMLLSVQLNGDGKRFLSVGFDASPGRLLALPRQQP